jgi:transposase
MLVRTSSSERQWSRLEPVVAGALRRGSDAHAEALGRSRGGFTTKLHAVVSAKGDLRRYVLTGGQVHDITQAQGLVAGLHAQAVIGDRAYDSDEFVAQLKRYGMKAVVPSRAGRRRMRSLDADAYRLRNVIKRWFGRLKQYRRVATRYDDAAKSPTGEKTERSYASLVATAALCVALSGWLA